jgi:hypothetical protein
MSEATTTETAFIATAIPCAWLGGKLRVMQLRERPATIRNSFF